MRLKTNSQPILQELDQLVVGHRQGSPQAEASGGATEDGMKVEHSTPAPSVLSSSSPVGDLEPSLEILELLVSTRLIQDDIPIILDADPITSLVEYKLPKLKPPPPPKPKKVPKVRPPRDREEENRRRREKREIERIARENAKENARAARAAAAAAAAMQQGYDTGTRSSRRSSVAANAESGDIFVSSSAVDFEVIPGQGPPLSTSSTSSNGARRRVPESGTSHPQILSTVDDKGSFALFNTGWILPSSQKRNRRPTLQMSQSMDRSAQPPPRKRPRMDPGSSRLSYSTVEEDNQTLQPSDPTQTYTDAEEDYPEMMDVDVPTELPPESSSVPPEDVDGSAWTTRSLPAANEHGKSSVEVTSGNNKLIIMPDGSRVLEELDTPATRREKNMRRKAERLAAAAAERNESQVENVEREVTSPVPIVADTFGTEAVAEPSGVENHADMVQAAPSAELPEVTAKDEADLGDISELLALPPSASVPGEEASRRTRNDRKRKRSSENSPTPSRGNGRTSSKSTPARKTGLLTRSAAAEPGTIALKNGEKLPGGTLVWAKSSKCFHYSIAVHSDVDYGVQVPSHGGRR